MRRFAAAGSLIVGPLTVVGGEMILKIAGLDDTEPAEFEATQTYEHPSRPLKGK